MCPEVTCDSSITVPALLQGEGENAAAGMDRSLPGARAARRGPSCERQDRQVRLREHLRMRMSWTIACRSCGLLGRCSRTRSSVGGPKHKRRVHNRCQTQSRFFRARGIAFSGALHITSLGAFRLSHSYTVSSQYNFGSFAAAAIRSIWIQIRCCSLLRERTTHSEYLRPEA